MMVARLSSGMTKSKRKPVDGASSMDLRRGPCKDQLYGNLKQVCPTWVKKHDCAKSFTIHGIKGVVLNNICCASCRAKANAANAKEPEKAAEEQWIREASGEPMHLPHDSLDKA